MPLVRKLWRSIVGLPVIAFVFALAQTPNAGAVVIYDFAGFCTFGCMGQADAVLTLADTYTPGTAAQEADFISFTYVSSNGTYTIPGDGVFQSFGRFSPNVLPAVSGLADIFIDFQGGSTAFQSDGGGWSNVFAPAGIADAGDEFGWTLRQTAVPEPATVLLFLVGLGLLIGLRRRTAAVRA